MNVGSTRVIYGPVEIDAYGALDDRRTARRKLGIPGDLPVVALIGRINRWKGHDRFVRIAALVNAVLPVRFIIVGAPIFRDADFVPELEVLIDRLGVRDRVSFHPWVTDVREVYAAIDLNANCSTREPFGRTLIEAAAAGVPTVCFSDSGASETIHDGVTGRCVDPGDDEGFARTIVEMLANRRRLPAISRAAREGVARFDAPRIAAEMADVIREAASPA
jgi:glycosyltransferase involved in cell wall biosynthesis